MVRSASSTSSRRAPKSFQLQKPNGLLSPRVQAVGPEHFGIAAFDPAKNRSAWMLTDFYGKVLIPPTTVEHERGPLNALVATLRAAMVQHQLRDITCAIERTGEYHKPLQRVLAHARFDYRIVHPFTSKQYRLPANPNDKSDPNDLAGITRATTQGFGLIEPQWPDLYTSLQLLCRQRRDLVKKTALLQCQIKETLHKAMPGYDQIFTHLWESPGALAVARTFASAAEILQAGPDGLRKLLTEAGIQGRTQTIAKLIDWAEHAPPGHPLGHHYRRAFIALEDDRRGKTKLISDLERDLASLVVQTPYALMLALPGINLVTSAEFAGEMGPIEFYLNPERITGRAGLFPSRYQSDQVDCTGPLVRRGNRRLRSVFMRTANNLLLHNGCYKARAERWARQGKDERWIRVKIAKSLSRLLFVLVAGRQLVGHLALQPKQYLLGKLLEFHLDHKTDPQRTRADMEALAQQLPARARTEEIPPLQEQLDDLERTARGRRGPQPLTDVLTIVLARLRVLQSESRENPS